MVQIQNGEQASSAEFRSESGKLLARFDPDGLVIKCARSKRFERLSWRDLHALEELLQSP